MSEKVLNIVNYNLVIMRYVPDLPKSQIWKKFQLSIYDP